MSRPKYETVSDLSNEVAVVEFFAKRFGVIWKKLPCGPRYAVDYAFFSNAGMVGVGEVKCRNERYDTLIIGLSKMRELFSYTLMGLGAVIIVRWPDGIWWCKVGPELMGSRILWGGREDRGDPNDLEPVMHIPVHHFIRVANDG